ncbi:MAG TPA: hypothetical protein VMT19_08645 [Thermoanaerobaculaceae bacterium]|nr:hypothetical protein [Thermoanaerobaculaceae bacterium]
MAPRNPPPGQLDIPLVWELEPPGGPVGPASAEGQPATPPFRAAGTLRLWVAALADAAITLIGVGAAVAAAALLLGGISPLQFALAAVAGVEAVSVAALGCLWGWRATPGMLVLGVCFSRPIPAGRVCRTWGVWLISMPLAGVPLVVRRGGESAAERLAGGALSYRSIPAGA